MLVNVTNLEGEGSCLLQGTISVFGETKGHTETAVTKPGGYATC